MSKVVLALLCGAHAVAAFGPAGQSFEKGIIYMQPSYHFANTLDLDMDVMRTDLNLIAQSGFVNVGLRVSWGNLMTEWNGATHTAVYNDDACTKLGTIAAELSKRKLRLIINTHLLDTVPMGVEGAQFNNQTAKVSCLTLCQWALRVPSVTTKQPRFYYSTSMCSKQSVGEVCACVCVRASDR